MIFAQCMNINDPKQVFFILLEYYENFSSVKNADDKLIILCQFYLLSYQVI